MSCNDQLFATGSFNRLIGLYDIDTMEHIATLKGHHGGVTNLQLSPDNMRLYSGARKVTRKKLEILLDAICQHDFFSVFKM